MKKHDWTGNKIAAYVTNGDSSHASSDRASNDYYATDPRAVELLCDLEKFQPHILEPACGEGHIAKVLESKGYSVESCDLVARGFGRGGVDFLARSEPFDGDIITNPPYSMAREFAEKALEIVKPGAKVAMFLKLTFLEGKTRRDFFKNNPPKVVYVASSRFECAKNGVFSGSLAIAYAWFVWEKGFTGTPSLKWFN